MTLKLVAADYGDSAAEQLPEVLGRARRGLRDRSTPASRSTSASTPGTTSTARSPRWSKAGKAPDIAQIGAYADYAADGKLYSADELLSIPVQADFLAQLADAGKVNGVQYGLPFVAVTRLLFYNKKLFAEAGIDRRPRPGTTSQTTPRRSRRTGVKYPYALPLGPEEAQAETMMWLLSGGGGYTDNVGTYAIDSAAEHRDLQLAAGRTGRQGPHRPRRARQARPREAPSTRSPAARSACSTATPR